MKDAKFLIEHIFSLHIFAKNLRSANECYELLQLIGAAQRRLIAFCYVKGSVLFIAVKHPVGLAELKRDSSINMIKGLLKAFARTRENSVLGQVVDIKFFVTSSLFYRPAAPMPAKISPLKSEAKFQNLATEPAIHAKFEELRSVIAQQNTKFKDSSC